MPKNNENVDSLPTKTVVRLPPKRGQIKAKIMTQFVRKLEEAGRALCGKAKGKVAKEAHPSQSHDSSHT